MRPADGIASFLSFVLWQKGEAKKPLPSQTFPQRFGVGSPVKTGAGMHEYTDALSV